MKKVVKIIGWLLIGMQVIILASGEGPGFKGNLLTILTELVGFLSFGIIGAVLLILGYWEKGNRKKEEKRDVEEKDGRSEIIYFDEKGRITTEDKGVKAVIKEYDEEGNLIREVFGSISK
jgi:hypothetical protein